MGLLLKEVEGGLVEKLYSWEVKDEYEWESLLVAMLVRLEQVLDISTSVAVGKNKDDLEKMLRIEKNEARRMKVVITMRLIPTLL